MMKMKKLLRGLHNSQDPNKTERSTADCDEQDSLVDEPFATDDELWQIACGIREMPDLTPPSQLVPSVMEALRTRQLPWWQRAYHWAKSPRSFILSPLQVGLLTVMLMVVPGLFTFYLTDESGQRLTDARHGKRVPVVFSLKLTQAHSVALIGTFNDWHPQGYEMQAVSGKPGIWTLTTWLDEGRYEYSFLVNGQKIMPDPKSVFYQDDGFGNQNAVLIVGSKDDKTI